MTAESETANVSYVIPARTITGSPEQILGEIDDMMEALQIVRETVVARTPRLACPPHRGWRATLGALLHLDVMSSHLRIGSRPTAR